ncbi:MAG: hypothetical protein WAW60_03775 [Candidatus Saccharimonadales bacterium]
MAKKSEQQQALATGLTAFMGMMVGAIAIFESQFGASDVTKVLFFVAIIGTMLSGVLAGILYYNKES